jgi:hypothetical protein
MPKRRRAYRQGDLDGLCGVYAIVNALWYVLRLREGQCQKLFAKLIKALEQECDQSWLGEFGQRDKWSFCLTAARMAAEQEKQ